MKNILNFFNKTSSSKLLKNTSITIVLRVSGALILLIFNWLIVKLLGADEAGTFFLAITIITVVSVFGLLGMDHYILRSLPKLKDKSAQSIKFSSGLLTVLMAATACTVAMLLLSRYLGDVFKSEMLPSILRILAISLVPLCLISYVGAALQGVKQYWKSIFVMTNLYYIVAIALFLVLLAVGSDSLNNLTTAFTAGLIVSLVITLAISSKHLSVKLSKVPSIIGTFTENTKAASGLFLVSLIYIGFGWADILIVGYFLPDSDVGIYSIALRISKLIAFVLYAVNIVIAPLISKLSKEKDIKQLNLVIQKGTILSAFFAIPASLVLIALAGPVLSLFGEEFRAGTTALQLLVVGQAVNALTGAVVVSMMMLGLEKQLNKIGAIVLVGQICLGIALTSMYGMNGAAAATMIGMSVINIMIAAYLYKSKNIKVIPSIKETMMLLRGKKS